MHKKEPKETAFVSVQVSQQLRLGTQPLSGYTILCSRCPPGEFIPCTTLIPPGFPNSVNVTSVQPVAHTKSGQGNDPGLLP